MDVAKPNYHVIIYNNLFRNNCYSYYMSSKYFHQIIMPILWVLDILQEKYSFFFII